MQRIALSLIAIILLMQMGSCRSEQPSPESEVVLSDSDSSVVAETITDTIENLPPAAADGLFDDFIYNFMRVHKFQFSRIQFPLPVYTDGKRTDLTRDMWKFDPIYAGRDIYTMIFDSPRSQQIEKDTTLNHVVVEWIYLKRSRVKQYIFDKLRGQWILTAISEHVFSQNPNNDFYTFYQNFASDEDFQKAHITNPFRFRTYDYDAFQEIDGVLDVEQWPDYRPELPDGRITNIIYGKINTNSKYRALVISSMSSGMNCTLVFRRNGRNWMLTEMEN